MRLTPEQRAMLIDCLRHCRTPAETEAITGLPRKTIWRYRSKSHDGVVPETRGDRPHKARKRPAAPKPHPAPNAVPGIPYARLVAGR
jgi:hypothetical protein